MGSPTGFLTLNISEWTTSLVPSHSDGAVSSLSDILETGDVLQRYYLSPKACAGILRRAEARKKVLPRELRMALAQIASTVMEKEQEAPQPSEAV
ncbi:MAG: hypothetical protein BGP09_31315 [Rhizobium sp. 60-20]|nr:MAG: hypothetical protein BGP09_31315 [Rhizobium sp. 60-20]